MGLAPSGIVGEYPTPPTRYNRGMAENTDAPVRKILL